MHEDDLILKCNNPDESISVMSSFITKRAKDSSHCTPSDEYKEDNECEFESSDVTHSVLRSCHGRNSCNFTGVVSLLSENACKIHQSLLNITYTCISRTNFQPEFLNEIVTQERHQTATKNETFKDKNEEENFELKLTARSSSPKRSSNQNIDNSKEKITLLNKYKANNVEHIFSLQKKGYTSDNENLINSQALNLLFSITSGFQQVIHILRVRR